METISKLTLSKGKRVQSQKKVQKKYPGGKEGLLIGSRQGRRKYSRDFTGEGVRQQLRLNQKGKGKEGLIF